MRRLQIDRDNVEGNGDGVHSCTVVVLGAALNVNDRSRVFKDAKLILSVSHGKLQ